MRINIPSRTRKQLLAGAVVVGLMAPAAAVPPGPPGSPAPVPEAQFTHVIDDYLTEGRQCGPYDLDYHCSGVPDWLSPRLYLLPWFPRGPLW